MTSLFAPNKKLVSIGMPVYNGEETMTAALDSLIAQTYSNFELHISDNCSTDNTAKVCERYLGLDPRISYSRNERNVGALANFDILLQAATGDLFMWAACDDVWEPDFIAELVRLLDADPTQVLAFCIFDFFDPASGSRFPGPDLRYLANSPSPFHWAARFLLTPEGLHKATPIYGLVRTDVMKKVGGMLPNAGGECFDIDNHTLFSIGLEGSLGISSRLLFHKGSAYYLDTEPDASMLPTLPTRKEIVNSYFTYRERISSSNLGRSRKMALQVLAVANLTRTVLGNLVETALRKWKDIPLVWRFYLFAQRRLGAVHVRDDTPSSRATDHK